MHLFRLLLPAAALLVIVTSAEGSLPAITADEVGKSECAMVSTLGEGSSLDTEGVEETAQWSRHCRYHHKHHKHQRHHKHHWYHRHHRHHRPKCVVETTTTVMICPTVAPTVGPTVVPTNTRPSIPSTTVKPTVQPTGAPVTTSASSPWISSTSSTTAAPPATTTTNPSPTAVQPTVSPTGSPATTTPFLPPFTPTSAATAAPSMTTTAIPPVTTIAVPPISTTAALSVTTTAVPPVTTSEAPPVTTSTNPSPTPTPDGLNTSTLDGLTEEQRTILSVHNELRAKHGVAPVTWNKAAEAFGAKWIAPLCTLQHSDGLFGENLAMGQPDWTSAVQDWYSEIKDYDFNNPGFSSNTGHFTQVVWKSTTSIGCAKKDCSGTPLYICNYDPAGNIDRPQIFSANVLPLV